jgi:hypothetical protein
MRMFSPRAVTIVLPVFLHEWFGIHGLGAWAEAPRRSGSHGPGVDVFYLFPELDLPLFGDLSNNLTVW